MNKMKDIYFNFLKLRQKLDQTALTYAMLDEISCKLLEIIAAEHQQGQTMTVTDVMLTRRIASPSTIHRKLIGLLDTGWIEQVFEGRNRRTKYLVPTAAANEYFAQLDLLMTHAIDPIQSITHATINPQQP